MTDTSDDLFSARTEHFGCLYIAPLDPMGRWIDDHHAGIDVVEQDTLECVTLA